MKYYEFETTEYPISYYLAKEEYLLTKNEEAFFVWNNLPGIVIGKNQVLEEEVNVAKAKEDKIPIYRRKSGFKRTDWRIFSQIRKSVKRRAILFRKSLRR